MKESSSQQQKEIAVNAKKDTELLESSRLGSEVLQAQLRVTDSLNQDVQKNRLGQESVSVFLSLDDMDDFAIAWCKHRKLQKHLGGPVGNEWGSPDCPYE